MLATKSLIGVALAMLGSVASAQSVTQVKDMAPFTHVALIPEGADLASIRFQGVKLVKVLTKERSVAETSYCREQALRDPGGSVQCPNIQVEQTASAYKVDYSYSTQPLASDEYSGRNFTFSVFYRSDELRPEALELISRNKGRHSDVAALFVVKTSEAPQHRVVIDERNSKFCKGNFIDGAWMQADSQCRDDIWYQTAAVAADYVTVRIDPALPRVVATR